MLSLLGRAMLEVLGMNLHIYLCLQLVSAQGMWMCLAGRDQGPLIPACSPPSLPPQPGSCAGLFTPTVPACPCPYQYKNLKFSISKIPAFLGRLEHLCPQLQVSIHLYCWQQRQSHPSYGRSWPAMQSAWACEAAWPQQDIHGVPRVLVLASLGQGAHSLPK